LWGLMIDWWSMSEMMSDINPLIAAAAAATLALQSDSDSDSHSRDDSLEQDTSSDCCCCCCCCIGWRIPRYNFVSSSCLLLYLTVRVVENCFV
jgi:hypothetical protein